MARSRNRNRNWNAKKPRFTYKLSEHFSKKDFMYTAEDGTEKCRISLGLVGGLELLRSLANNRINIVRGYITPEAAEKQGNFKRNYHPLGLAADITIDNLSPKDVFLLAEQVPEFKGLGLNLTSQYVHVDTRKQAHRDSWVVEEGRRIDLTEENRKKYFETPVS